MGLDSAGFRFAIVLGILAWVWGHMITAKGAGGEGWEIFDFRLPFTRL